MHEDIFANRLRSLLETRKLTGKELARQIGTTQQAVSKWLKGGNIEYRNLRALAGILQVDWLWLRYGDEALRDKGQPAINVMDQRRRQYVQEIMDTQERMIQALKVAKVATGEWNPVTGEIRNTVNVQEVFWREIRNENEWLELIHLEDLPRVQEEMQNIATTSQPKYCDYRIVHPQTREIKWVVTRAQNFFDNEGHPVRLVAMTIDITDRKQAEKDAEQARTTLSQILDSITDGCFTLAADWRVTYVNFQAERLLKLSAEEMLGRSIWELFPEALQTKFHQQYEHALIERLAVHFEEFYPPLAMWFDVHAYPFLDGIAVYFRDITKIRQTEAAAAEATAQLQQIEEITGLGLLQFEGRSGQLMLSQQVASLFGIAPSQVATRAELDLFVVEEDRQPLSQQIEQAWLNKSAYESQYSICLPDGSVRRLLEKGRVVINPDHLQGQIVATIIPLSQ